MTNRSIKILFLYGKLFSGNNYSSINKKSENPKRDKNSNLIASNEKISSFYEEK